MLDIGWTELLVIAIVLIVVVGPKDLPPMLRAFGKMTANLRKMAGEFRTQFDEALRESELDDVRKTISDAQRLNPTNALRDAINPLRQMGQEIKADLQKATQVTDAAAAKVDTEAQQAVEGSSAGEAVTASEPSSAPAPATSQPLTPVPAAPEAVAPAAIAEKPKAGRKTVTRAKSAADVSAPAAAAIEKPKRSRSAKSAPVTEAPVTQAMEKAAAKTSVRKRAPKKTDTQKGDA
ncbi:Sec-independent protein translocase protein TatB [Neorhizobium petrolearium]|uniref:Sec-independent protein translocase protein TatB n=1 Tax=Neorhizobium petrolearium TaxID=515361 RepID=A0ABY8M651_9HYPH|nr:Sec-independent protein translocase protein TatB [Neorhizobium petrolearium]MCC2609817.1 Sec-independent protein translocase protein TatB [Neorhizobium petrolearium]WGI70005.1 Sec-independent protein translocase protein TatB [Neorhizobium petrolearium]